MIRFGLETWPEMVEEAKSLWPAHYEAVGLGKLYGFELDPDYMKIGQLHSRGMLHVVTVRDEGRLRGYHVSIVDTLLHYRTVLCANADIYWLDPECRKGRVALRMFEFVEKTLKARGVKLMMDGTKLALDRGELFEFLGYELLEKRYSKWIGG